MTLRPFNGADLAAFQAVGTPAATTESGSTLTITQPGTPQLCGLESVAVFDWAGKELYACTGVGDGFTFLGTVGIALAAGKRVPVLTNWSEYWRLGSIGDSGLGSYSGEATGGYPDPWARLRFTGTGGLVVMFDTAPGAADADPATLTWTNYGSLDLGSSPIYLQDLSASRYQMLVEPTGGKSLVLATVQDPTVASGGSVGGINVGLIF